MDKKLAKYSLRIIGLVILALILMRMDVMLVVRELSKTNILWISVAVILIIPTIYLRALRWRYALCVQNIKVSRYDAFQMHLASSFIGQITPGRLGEFVKALYIKAPLHKSVISVIVDRLFDLAVLVLLSVAGLYLLPSEAIKPAIIAGILILAAIVITTIAVSRHLPWLISKTIGRLLPKKIGRRALKGTAGLKAALAAYKLKDYIAMSMYTLASYVIYYGIFYAAARSISLQIPLLYMISCLAITSVVSFLPISFLGIGTRDISLVFLFALIGLSSESAVAYSTLILLINIAGALFGLVAWIKRPIKI